MLSRSSSAMVSMTNTIDDRMMSRIDVINAASSADRTTVYIWVKNVGNSQLNSIEQTDVFLGPQGNYIRIPYVTDAAGGYPQWAYSIENGTGWGPNSTIKITVTFQSDPGPGTYYVKIVIANGISAEYYFSM